MRNLIKNVELLESYIINLVHRVQAWYVFSIALYDVDDIILRGIALDRDVTIIDLIFPTYGLRMILANITLMVSSSIRFASTILDMEIPPLSRFRNSMLGGYLFNLIPKPSSSLSMIFL